MCKKEDDTKLIYKKIEELETKHDNEKKEIYRKIEQLIDKVEDSFRQPEPIIKKLC